MAKTFTRNFTPVYIDSTSKEPVMNVSGNVTITGVSPVTEWDSITITYPDGATEVYTYTLLGSPVQVITVVYTAVDKLLLSSVTKS